MHRRVHWWRFMRSEAVLLRYHSGYGSTDSLDAPGPVRLWCGRDHCSDASCNCQIIYGASVGFVWRN